MAKSLAEGMLKGLAQQIGARDRAAMEAFEVFDARFHVRRAKSDLAQIILQEWQLSKDHTWPGFGWGPSVSFPRMASTPALLRCWTVSLQCINELLWEQVTCHQASPYLRAGLLLSATICISVCCETSFCAVLFAGANRVCREWVQHALPYQAPAYQPPKLGYAGLAAEGQDVDGPIC